MYFVQEDGTYIDKNENILRNELGQPVNYTGFSYILDEKSLFKDQLWNRWTNDTIGYEQLNERWESRSS